MTLSKEERSKINKAIAQKIAKEKYDKTHKELNGEIYKLCSKHKEFFPDEEEWFPCTTEYFYINKSNFSDGLHPYCKRCGIAKMFKRLETIPQVYNKAYHTKWNHENIEKIKKSSNKRRLEGKHKEWQQNNRDKVRAYQKEREQHKLHRVYKKEWEGCLEYFNNCCAYCGISLDEHKCIYREQLHKEHVYENGRNDLKNCIPACKSCNSMKLKQSFNDWYNPSNPNYTYDRYHKICQWLHYDYKKYIQKKNKRKNNK